MPVQTRFHLNQICGAALLLAPFTLLAQQRPESLRRTTHSVAQAVDSFRRAEHAPAVAIAVIRQGRLLVDTALGFADLEDSAHATRHTRFRVGSISKTITAAAVLHAADNGLVSLAAEIQSYVPAFPRKAHPVLVHQLLTGTAGVRGYRGDEYRRFERFASLASSLSIFADDTLTYVPGTSYAETPYGFTLLALALEAQSNKRYEQYVEMAVLRPAGMHETSPDEWARVMEHRAKPYTRDSIGRIRNAEPIDVSYKMPAGGWVATAGDIARFGGALVQRVLFSRVAYDAMMSPVHLADGTVLPLGMATAIGTGGGRLPGDEEAIWTSGLVQGGTAVLIMYPKSNLAVAVLCNINGELGTEGYNYLMRQARLAVDVARKYR